MLLARNDAEGLRGRPTVGQRRRARTPQEASAVAVARPGKRLVDLETDGAAAAGAGEDSCHSSPRISGTAAPPAAIPSTSTSGPPIMKSVWIVELLKPSSSRSSASARHRPRRVEDRRCRRRCGSCVLVEEGVQEDQARSRPTRESPSTSATSPRHARAVVGARCCSRTASTPELAFTSTARPPSKRNSRSRTTVPAQRQGLRRADRALGAAPVGRREHLLGRHVRRRAGGRRPSPPAPCTSRARDQPDAEVGAAARGSGGESKRALVQRGARYDELLDVLPPRLDGVGLVEARRRGNGVPEPLDVGLAEDSLRPALVRVRRRSSS